MPTPDGGTFDEPAEKLYNAVILLLRDNSSIGLLVAVGDAKDRIPWDKAHSKTRDLFRHLAVNLTELPPPSRLGS